MDVLDLLQLMDTSFPNGGHAHSFGLEWLDSQGGLQLEALLRLRLSEHLARVELPILRAAHDASDQETLVDLDHLVDVLTPVRELRAASRSIGHSFLRAATKLREGGLPAAAAERGVEHQPVAYGAVLRDWEVPLDNGLGAYAMQATRQQLMAAQRLGRIGQSAVQELLHALKPAMRAAVDTSLSLPIEEAGAFSPWLDMAGIRHEQQFARLFQS
ncbi:MAG TPA: urease accessory UreF family protein [Chloroflexota bacterium]|nr:urease accessory UreF family protein [Chloroflexota bacterium]